MSFAMEAAA
jgi:hypothetical protein